MQIQAVWGGGGLREQYLSTRPGTVAKNPYQNPTRPVLDPQV